MIGKTERDEIIQGNNEPSGRLNLKGQQKPQYLVDAIEAEEKAWKEYNNCDYNKGDCVNKKIFGAWQNADNRKKEAYARYNKECKNESL